jgi:outer membrane protein assembly factor BamB
MKRVFILLSVIVVVATSPVFCQASEQDWPQWRGQNRDGHALGFVVPKTWPKELTQKWKVTVGDGVASPALADGKLFVFSREDSQEILRCLDANTGKEIWRDQYESPSFTGYDNKYQGPRSSPTVANGKVVIVGVLGVVNCYDAAGGKKLWTKSIGAPMFHTSSSPIISDGLCILQIGGKRNGVGNGMAACDLSSGEEKWKWNGDGAAYASPVLVNVGTTKAIVAVTDTKLVAVNAANGKGMWEIPCRQLRYQSASPVVNGATIIYAGPMQGLTAATLALEGDSLTAQERWRQPANSLMYNTPVLNGGALYGISGTDNLFCLNSETGEPGWSTSIDQPGSAASAAGRGTERGVDPNKGYGNVVDTGSVLIALGLGGQLVVFEPNSKEFKLIASYKVAERGTYAYPIIAGNRIYVKDSESITLWEIE